MSIEDIREVRLAKLQKIKDRGMDPYPASSSRTHSIEETIDDFDMLSTSGERVTIAGRVMSLRGQGALIFFDLFDGTGRFQGLFKKEATSNDDFIFFNEVVDIGDFIEATGTVFLTKTGQKTVQVESWRMLSKSLLPLPEKWHGLQDVDERFRKRYLDILGSDDVRAMIERKAKFWNAVRQFHIKHGFLEVETPALETTTGGADANPFLTHHQALDMDVFLRISAGELWQKRLLVAGFPKTFEVGRIFRNEGISAEHAQDYTQCEAYWAYSNCEEMYNFLRECFQYVAKETFGTLEFKIKGFDVDLSGVWPTIDFAEEIERQTGIDIWKASDKDIEAKILELGMPVTDSNRGRLLDILWKHCRKNIAGPAILINEPKVTSPLSKVSPTNPLVTERFHFIIAGSEVGQGYSELNDPIDQRKRFEEQQALRDEGDKEAQMADYEFVEALEYAMPPAAGHGFSERLFAFLEDKPIREVQLFPLMKPKA